MNRATSDRRLLKLAKRLESVPPERFNMGRWVGDWKGKLDFSCGTSACAAGWATTISSFRRAGFYLDNKTYPSLATVTYKGSRAFKACAEFFGITHAEADKLFGPRFSTPEQKAREIIAFVKRRGTGRERQAA